MPYQPALAATLEHIAELDAAAVAALTSTSPADRTHAAQGRRALALSDHGVEFTLIDSAIRTARPDLSPPVRAALRWAVLAETFSGSLTREQRGAITGHLLLIPV